MPIATNVGFGFKITFGDFGGAYKSTRWLILHSLNSSTDEFKVSFLGCLFLLSTLKTGNHVSIA